MNYISRRHILSIFFCTSIVRFFHVFHFGLLILHPQGFAMFMPAPSRHGFSSVFRTADFTLFSRLAGLVPVVFPDPSTGCRRGCEEPPLSCPAAWPPSPPPVSPDALMCIHISLYTFSSSILGHHRGIPFTALPGMRRVGRSAAGTAPLRSCRPCPGFFGSRPVPPADRSVIRFASRILRAASPPGALDPRCRAAPSGGPTSPQSRLHSIYMYVHILLHIALCALHTAHCTCCSASLLSVRPA